VIKTVTRFVIIVYLVGLHAVAVYLLLERFGFVLPFATLALPGTVVVPSNSQSQIANLPIATATPATILPPAASLESRATTPLPLQPSSSSLVIPVAGVSADRLTDTFADARSGGRVHDAIDIPAAAGTSVIAAVDGTILKFHDSALGGITIYQLSDSGSFVLYYAHLQRRAEAVHEGDRVRKGETIAYVGDTGNAGAGNFHLHFAIWRVTDPKHFWTGDNIDPYPLLRNGLPLPIL